jgi:hypothetical protein
LIAAAFLSATRSGKMKDMLALEPNRKKRIETHYMEEARRASSIFPAGTLEPYERPDFLLRASHGKIGIEVTELCREDPRAEAGRLSKVPGKAKTIYDRFPDAEPVDVGIGFWRAETVGFNALTKSLADFVYANRSNKGTGYAQNLPDGYCHIGIHEPLVPGGRWHGGRAFDTVVAPTGVSMINTPVPGENSAITPVLQAQDGSFVGTFVDFNTSLTSMIAFDASGNLLWSVPNEQPQIATADGGVIGQSGITYDQNGSATGQGPLYTQSWTGNMYRVGSIDRFFVPPALLATSFWAFQCGNASGNCAGAQPLPDRVKAFYDVVGPDPLPPGAALRKINYQLYQGVHIFPPNKQAVIKEFHIYSFGPHPQTSQSGPGAAFEDEIGVRAGNSFGLTQQFFASLPGTRDIRLQIVPCVATNTLGDATWQNVILASSQTVSINNNAGSTQARTCSQ